MKICYGSILTIFIFISILNLLPVESIKGKYCLTWKEYVLRYNITDTEEHRQAFRENIKLIEMHNSNSAHRHRLGCNHLMHLSPKTFSKGYSNPSLLNLMGWLRNKFSSVKEDNFIDDSLPRVIDWRNHRPRVLSRIEHQGNCGSCWAFSTISSIESIVAIESNQSVIPLSTEYILECNTKKSKCKGGYPETAFKFAKGHHLCKRHELPYAFGQADETCKILKDKCKNGPIIKGFTGPDEYTNAKSLRYVLSLHPVQALVNSDGWQFYEVGTFIGSNNKSIDHAINVVGYDNSDPNNPYWIIRNSWGTWWGLEGYMYLSAKKGEDCGILEFVSWPKYKNNSSLNVTIEDYETD